MFKRKKEDIEQDFISYGNESHDTPKKSSVLGTVIQLLSVVILLGIALFMGMFGYKYWQKEFKEKISKPVEQIATTPRYTPDATPQKPKQKLYTQEEMQAIVTMLMEQMQKQKPEQSQLRTAKADNTPAPQNSEATSPGKQNTDTSVLVSELADAEINELENESSPRVSNLDSKHYTTLKAAKKVKTDTYNKVVVKKHQNSYDDLANLSRKIGHIVDTMQHKSKSTYTSSIKKEVKTRSREMRVIIVRRGDTLSKIALRAYGSAMAYDAILQANPDLIKNPNHIYVGQHLRVPLKKQ
jgi:cell division protein FtsI/penicillin-binding protein 2